MVYMLIGKELVLMTFGLYGQHPRMFKCCPAGLLPGQARQLPAGEKLKLWLLT
jgi:hypothetical protein